MTSTEISESVLDDMSKEYQIHKVQIQKSNMSSRRHDAMILKLYRPRVPTTVNPNESLIADFNKKYEDLFFKHLERVITNNNITLQIHKARVNNVLSQFDQYLHDLKTTPQHKRQLYDSKTTRSQENLKVRKILPQTHTSPITSTTNANTPRCESPSPHHYQPKAGKKRNISKPHPKAKKVTKQHFLSQTASTTLAIHNLSDTPLTDADLKLLSKGLTFAPTPTTQYKNSQLQLLAISTNLQKHYNQHT